MIFNQFKEGFSDLRSRILLITLLLANGSVQAIVPPDYKDAADKPWSGRVEFGYHFNKSNKTTTSIDTKAEIEYEGDSVDHSLIFSTLYTEDDFEPTNNKLRLEFQSDLEMANDHYMFFRADLESNQYGSLKEKNTFTSGYGFQVYKTLGSLLKLEFGPGYRSSKPQTPTNETTEEHELIVRGVAKLEHTFNDHLKFLADTSVEAGEQNTITTITSSLQNQLIFDLALLLQVEYTNTQVVPEGSANDEITQKINIQYSFW